MRILAPHLFPPPPLLDAAADLRLPALQRLLGRGRRTVCRAAGVEAALCEALGIERQHDWPLAPIGLEADGGPLDDAYWLRTDPVHLRLMRDHIVLAPEQPVLTADEAQALTAAIGKHFGDTSRPLALTPQRWYLAFNPAPEFTTTPPSLAAGRDVQHFLPQGRDAARFRAWLNEVQMLLHDHPVNQAREARGLLPANALWPWGGGVRPIVPPQTLRIACETDTLQAIVRFAGATLVPASHPHPDLIVFDGFTTPVQTGDLSNWRDALRRFDAQLAHLLRLRAQLDVCDPVHGIACQLQRWRRWTFWRRSPPLRLALQRT
jgi:hypothetical protein